MKCDFYSLTDAGRVRTNNEDTVAVQPEVGLVVLADGMGGYNAGEVASALATQALTQRFDALMAAEPVAHGRTTQLLRDAIDTANRAVFHAAQGAEDLRGMATTLVAAVFQRSRLTIGHVGDSRAYRLRQGALTCLTRDHSLLQEQLDAGLIPAHLARLVQYKNLVTRAIGVGEAVEAELHEHVVQAGDTYLFCSDGLNDMLSDAEMSQILLHHGPMEQAGQELLRRANAAGGRDNISLVLVQCTPEPAHPTSSTGLMAH